VVLRHGCMSLGDETLEPDLLSVFASVALMPQLSRIRLHCKSVVSPTTATMLLSALYNAPLVLI
jgi:hypothetical protein